MKGLKGLRVSIYRNAEFGDCSLGGISSRVNSIVLIGPDVPEVTEVPEGEEALFLIPGRYLRCVSFDDLMNGNSPAAGGNYIFSSDSTFRKISPYPIPVHDRIEKGRK